ncbi:hypothetical protein ACFX15_031236 [Malus domestica]
MYVVHPDWLRPRNRGVLINCEGFTQVHRFKFSLSRCGIFSGSTLPPSRVVSVTGGDAQGNVSISLEAYL